MENPLVLLHYVGTWERYSVTPAGRPKNTSWTHNFCDKKVQTWLPKFVQQVGETRASFLLGHTNRMVV